MKITKLLIFFIIINIYAQDYIPFNYPSIIIPDPNAVFDADLLGGQWKPESIDNYTSDPAATFPVLIVYAEFLNDPGPDNGKCPWHVGQNPTFMGSLLSIYKKTNNDWWDTYDESSETLSDYWMEVSRGELHITGKEVHVILPQTADWYKNNGKTAKIMDDLYDELAGNPSIQWLNYDVWSKETGNWQYTPDGYLDMMYIIFRSRPDDVGFPNGGQTPMPLCSHAGGHLIYDNGIKQVIVKPVLSHQGSGFLNTPGWGMSETGYIMNMAFGKNATMGLSQHEHGHYLLAYRDPEFFQAHQQYGKVNNYHGWDYFYSPYEMIRLGFISTRKVNFSTSSSYSINDFTSRGDVSEILEVPIGEASRNEFFLIANRMKESIHDRLMYGDTAHDNPWRNINPNYEKGLYIYHAYPGYAGQGYQWQIPIDMECADGLFNWVQDGYQHPDWSCSQNVEYYKRSSVVYNQNDNGGELVQGLSNHDGKSIYNWFGIGKKEVPACSSGDGTDRIYTNYEEIWTSRELLGDRWDAWREYYNEVFSPYSSPSTVNWSNEGTGIFIYLESQNGNIANFKIYKTGEGYTEDQILALTPPSKPMMYPNFSVVECNGEWAHPQIVWENNKEPDMISYDINNIPYKKYKIYRAFSGSIDSMPAIYNYLDTYNDYTFTSLPDTASYIDRNQAAIFCNPDLENPDHQYFRYKVVAVDVYNSESIKSDFVHVKGNLNNPDIPVRNVPILYSLQQNFPNPFNPSTEIKFSIAYSSNVTLKVYNLLGEEIAVLINNEYKEKGNHSIRFDGTNLASGVYFYKLEAGNFVQTKKMVLIK